jgi:hypothetical protein
VELHEEKKLLEVIDGTNREMVESKIQEYTEQIRNKDTEQAVVITRTGKVYQCFGTKNSVYPDYDLGDQLIGADVTHNHPEEQTHYSFSGQDIGIFLNQKQQSLTGVDERYEYQMTRTPETREEDISVIDIQNKFSRKYYLEVLDQVAKDKLDIDTDQYHETCKKFAKEYHFRYERKESV